MTSSIIGLHKWGPLEVNDEGHRAYQMTTKIKCTTSDDGPSVVHNTAGLPAVGSTWNIGNDNDSYAYCTPYARVYNMQEGDGERALYWFVDQKFTTRPMTRCNTAQIDNPLSEPAQIRGGFAAYREEAIYDNTGALLLMSSLERMKGPEVEIEKGRPIVVCSFNVAALPLTTFSPMMDTGAVNDATLWGCAARTVRLSEVTWERYLYGICTYYYRVNYSFEIKWDGWNRLIIDQGTKVRSNALAAISATNPLIPFVNFYTGKAEVAYLNGTGDAVYVDQGASLGSVWVWEKALEVSYNFLTLGIPTTL